MRQDVRKNFEEKASDGLGIYLKAGFKAVGDVHTFENRIHLFV